MTQQTTLLLVDDDVATRYLVKEIFDNVNINILEAENSRQAVLLFKNHLKRIDLILLDIHLPDNDGFSLLKQLRLIRPCVPAIALSALEPAWMERQCQHSGFSAFISKPFDIADLHNTVANYLKLPVNVALEK